MKFQARWLLDLEPNDVIKLEVVHLLFFKSTCITVSTWQPRKDVKLCPVVRISIRIRNVNARKKSKIENYCGFVTPLVWAGPPAIQNLLILSALRSKNAKLFSRLYFDLYHSETALRR